MSGLSRRSRSRRTRRTVVADDHPLDSAKSASTVTARGDDKGGGVILPHPNGLRRMKDRVIAA